MCTQPTEGYLQNTIVSRLVCRHISLCSQATLVFHHNFFLQKMCCFSQNNKIYVKTYITLKIIDTVTEISEVGIVEIMKKTVNLHDEHSFVA